MEKINFRKKREKKILIHINLYISYIHTYIHTLRRNNITSASYVKNFWIRSLLFIVGTPPPPHTHTHTHTQRWGFEFLKFSKKRGSDFSYGVVAKIGGIFKKRVLIILFSYLLTFSSVWCVYFVYLHHLYQCYLCFSEKT